MSDQVLFEAGILTVRWYGDDPDRVAVWVGHYLPTVVRANVLLDALDASLEAIDR